MGDTVTGTVGNESATAAIGKGNNQSAAYGGSVYVVGRDGRGEMATNDYVILLLEQVNQRVSRVEQLSLQAATEQGSNRAELLALKSEIKDIREDLRLLKEERQKERERLPLGINATQYKNLIRVVVIIAMILASIFLVSLLHEINLMRVP